MKYEKIEAFVYAMAPGHERTGIAYRVAPNTVVARSPRKGQPGWQILQESTGLRVQGGFRTRDAARTVAVLLLEVAHIDGIPRDPSAAVELLGRAVVLLRKGRAPFNAVDWLRP